jgi:hypothetical protein
MKRFKEPRFQGFKRAREGSYQYVLIFFNDGCFQIITDAF